MGIITLGTGPSGRDDSMASSPQIDLTSTDLVISATARTTRTVRRFHPKKEIADSPSSFATRIAPQWRPHNIHNIHNNEEASNRMGSDFSWGFAFSVFSRSEPGSPWVHLA